MIKAILFDMDGTITDTEKYLTKYNKMVFEEFGYNVSMEFVYSLRSLTRTMADEYVREKVDPLCDYEKVRKRRRELLDEVLKGDNLQLKPFVFETLEKLDKTKYQLVVVTATDEVRANEYLERLNVRSCFDRVISTKRVKIGKPLPDVYLYTCEQLGIKPCEALAIEDSPNGVTSAYSAGCKVVMVPDLTPCDDETRKKTDYVFDNISGILNIL